MNEIHESKQQRHAPALDIARNAFNAWGPLLALRRFEEARVLLDECRTVFEREREFALLGKVFGALSRLETELGHHDDARAFTERQLRSAYRAHQAEDIALGHDALAVNLHNTRQDPALILAHSVAAATIALQIHSSLFELLLAGLRTEMSAHGGHTALPASFDDLCEQVEKVPGVCRLRYPAEPAPDLRFPDQPSAGAGLHRSATVLAALGDRPCLL